MDEFLHHDPNLESPGRRHAMVTPGPDDLDPLPRALKALTDGEVTIVDAEGVSIEYPVTAGEILPFRAVKVTAATAVVVAWW